MVEKKGFLSDPLGYLANNIVCGFKPVDLCVHFALRYILFALLILGIMVLFLITANGYFDLGYALSELFDGGLFASAEASEAVPSLDKVTSALTDVPTIEAPTAGG